jgi:hypothetical protein
MKTWNVIWSCDNECCGISVSVMVKTMTRRESDPNVLITMAKQKLFSADIDSSWFGFTPSIKEIDNGN